MLSFLKFLIGGSFAVGFGILTIILFFFNFVVGAYTFPYIYNTIATSMHKIPAAVWWHGALFSLVPFFGRWWVGLVVCVLVSLFV